MNGIIEFFRGLGPARLATMAAVGASLVAFFFFITMHLTAPKMALLYADLDAADSAKIQQKLDAQSVPYRLNSDGSTILVPEDKVHELRMSIAQDGALGGSSVGYEIFDKTDALGTTTFVQNINHVRALEGELARTIRSIENIASARVHLVLPQRQLFSRSEQMPSASIAVKARGQLTTSQVKAVQNLVASAVPDLDPDRVSIVDQRGTLLAKGTAREGADALASTLEEKRVNYERRIREEVEALLERTVGLGKVRTEVTVEMDLSRVTTSSEIYDPESQVARSTVTVEDRSNDSESSKSQSVSIANNLPDADTSQDGDKVTNSSTSARNEETVNYEISRTTKTEVHEAGTVKRLSVAVLVDGRYEEGKDGNITYSPRPKEELAQLTALVRSAIGYDEKRGDHVEVVNLRFAEIMGSDESPIEINIMGFQKADLFRIAELFVLGLVGVLVILLVLRPLIMKIVSIPVAPAHAARQGQLPAGAIPGALMAPEQMAYAALPPAENGVAQIPVDEAGKPLTARQIAERPGGLETAIEVASIESRVQGSALKKVGDLVDRHPEEATSVIRNWLYGG
ncbi:MAG: flagellar M-ring protein FliF [Sphingomonadales bacterium]|nr:flagellar M-ring protein FliF [Sphingomonadales bacterium]